METVDTDITRMVITRRLLTDMGADPLRMDLLRTDRLAGTDTDDQMTIRPNL